MMGISHKLDLKKKQVFINLIQRGKHSQNYKKVTLH